VTTTPGLGALHQTTDDSVLSVNTVVAGVTPATTLAPNANGQTKRVIYEPTSLSSLNPTDSFTYNVSDGSVSVSNTVTIKLITIDNPATRRVTFNENELKVLVLGGVTTDGVEPTVVIRSVPVKGKLYQANFNGRNPGAYGDIPTNVGQLTEINTPDTVLTDFHGVLLYKPVDNEYSVNSNTVYAQFNFAWRHPVFPSIESAVATVELVVLFKNDPPIGVAANRMLHDENVTVFTLASTDTDGSTVGNSRFYRISQFPKLGTLYQVTDSGATVALGDSILDRGNVPTVVAWASEVLSASSQFTRCEAAGCASFATCPNACPNGVSDYHAVQVLGQPNAFPIFGDSPVTWSFATLDSPVIEWIIVRFPNPIFVSGLDLYENQAPGALISVEAATNFQETTVASLQWQTVWQGPVQQSLPATYRIFSPPICPVGFISDVIRLRFDSAQIAGWTEIDAIKLIGTIGLPKGKVIDTNGRVAYVPRAGLHRDNVSNAYDTFSFRISDCVAESGVDTTVTVTRPSQAFSTYNPVLLSQWRTVPAVLPAGETTAVKVNVQAVLDDLQAVGIVSKTATLASLGGATVQVVGATVEGKNLIGLLMLIAH